MSHSRVLIDIRRIVRAINLESKKIQKRSGVSIPQLLSLQFIAEQKDGITSQRALREYLNLNSSTVTGIVQRLEKKGLIEKLPRSEDRRVQNLKLTKTGNELLRHSPELLQDLLERRMQHSSPETQEQIRNGLQALVNLLGLDDLEAGSILTTEEIPE